MGWLQRIRQGLELLDTIATIAGKAADISEARKLAAKAAERGDLDLSLQRVIDATARSRTYEKTGK